MFSRIALSATGRVQATNSMTPYFIAGIGYDAATSFAYIDDGAVDPADCYINGFRLTPTGAVRIYDATAGLPANTSINQGFTLTDDGQLCITTDANALVYTINAISLDEEGRVYMDLL